MSVRQGPITAKTMKCAGTITEASAAIPETPVRRLTPKPLRIAVSAGLRLSARVSRHQLYTNT